MTRCARHELADAAVCQSVRARDAATPKPRSSCPVRLCRLPVPGTEWVLTDGDNFECGRGHYLTADDGRLVRMKRGGVL